MIRLRSFLPALALVLLASSATAAPPAAAHHGGTGDYEARSPVYLSGTVTETRYGAPHAVLTLRVPQDARVPRELPGAEELRGHEHWQGRPRAEGAGEEREILLPPDLTAQVGALANRPEPGDEVAAIAYRRCAESDGSYADELRVQLLYAAGQRFAYGGSITRIVPACENGIEGEAGDPADRTGDGGTDAAAPAADDAGLLRTALVVGGVLGVVAVGFAVVRLTLARLRRVSGGDGR